MVLIEEARSLLAKRFNQNDHEIVAAVRTCSDKITSAVHAETIAIGRAAAFGDTNIEAIVAGDNNGRIRFSMQHLPQDDLGSVPAMSGHFCIESSGFRKTNSNASGIASENLYFGLSAPSRHRLGPSHL